MPCTPLKVNWSISTEAGLAGSAVGVGRRPAGVAWAGVSDEAAAGMAVNAETSSSPRIKKNLPERHIAGYFNIIPHR